MSRIWLDKRKMSSQALHYCMNFEDNPKVRKYITDSLDCLFYCRDFKDREEVRNNISQFYCAYLYCKTVRNDIEWVKKLAGSEVWNT